MPSKAMQRLMDMRYLGSALRTTRRPIPSRKPSIYAAGAALPDSEVILMKEPLQSNATALSKHLEPTTRARVFGLSVKDDGSHNHEATTASSHVVYRKAELTKEVMDEIANATKMGEFPVSSKASTR